MQKKRQEFDKFKYGKKAENNKINLFSALDRVNPIEKRRTEKQSFLVQFSSIFSCFFFLVKIIPLGELCVSLNCYFGDFGLLYSVGTLE